MNRSDLLYTLRVVILAVLLATVSAWAFAQPAKNTFPLGKAIQQQNLIICLTKEDAVLIGEASVQDPRLATLIFAEKAETKQCFFVPQAIVVTYHKLEWRSDKPDKDGDFWSVYSATSGKLTFYEVTFWKHQVVET